MLRLACALADTSDQLTIAPVRRIVTIVDGEGGSPCILRDGRPERFEFRTADNPATTLTLTYERSKTSRDLVSILAIEPDDGESIVLLRRVYRSDAID
jgi:hypothetical protein